MKNTRLSWYSMTFLVICLALSESVVFANSDMLSVRWTSIAPIIDGEQDVIWNQIPADTLTKFIINENYDAATATDLLCDFRAICDYNNLYFFIHIVDDVVRTDNPNFWEGDGVEFFIDGDNSKTVGSYDGLNDIVIIIRQNAKDPGDITLLQNEWGFDPYVIDFAIKNRTDGWNLEISIPLKDLQIPSVSETLFGFEMHYDDNDSGNRDHIAVWHYSESDDAWLDASVLGVAKLVHAPALSNDVGIISVEMDALIPLNKTQNIKINMKNFGKEAQSNFQIGYQIGSSTPVIENYALSLASNETDEYTFQTSWTPDQLGYIEITAFTNLESDENTENDSLKKNVQVNDAVYVGTQDFRVNEIEGTCDQYVTSIAVDGAGNFVIAWVDYRLVTRDIYAQRYNSEGIAQGQNFRVSTGSGGQIHPSIATDKSGNFVIAWLDGRNGNLDIYAQRYNSSGEEQGTNFKVNDDTGNLNQRAPSVAMDGAGNFIITWEDYRNDEDDYFSDIYVQRYNSTGEMQGKNFKVNDTPISWGRYPSIAIDGSGNFVIAWQDGRNGNYDIYAQRYNSSGEEQGTNFKVNDDTGSDDQNDPSIAINESGNFVITWEDYRGVTHDIYAQRYNSNGEERGTNFRVPDDPENSYNYHFEPSIAIDESGNFIIVWYDDRNYDNDIYAQRYNSSGTPIGNNFRVTAEWNKDKGQVSPDVKLWDNKIYNCWASRQIGGTGYDIWANVLIWNKPLSVKEPISGNRLSYQLFQNYPNPFNPNTTIEYSLLHKTFVSLKVFNILGQEILTLVQSEQPSGHYKIQLNNQHLSNGIYIYRLETEDFIQSRRMIILK